MQDERENLFGQHLKKKCILTGRITGLQTVNRKQPTNLLTWVIGWDTRFVKLITNRQPARKKLFMKCCISRITKSFFYKVSWRKNMNSKSCPLTGGAV